MLTQPRKPRVLVVDDHPANRLAFETVLESDYTVFLAESGRQALELTLKVEFAVILMDVRMPEMSGYDTAAELRRRPSTRFTPIIFTSAVDQTLSHMNHAFAVGATDYIFSPVDAGFLKFKVATYAGMFLRHEALQLKVERLTELLRSVRDEVRRNVSSDIPLMDKIGQLDEVIGELKRQAVNLPY
jgi:response regulator RpfG family c-di-GMP phosphodiesterase